MTKFPLRTKRKMATREKLVRAARQLFLTKGYDNTTLEEIAELSGLHVQTLYRHFGTKQDLAKAGDERWFRIFETTIRTRDEATSTFSFWRDFIETSVAELTSERDLYRSHLRMRHSSPTILGATQEIRYRYEDILTEHLARDFGMDADGISIPRLVACALLGGNNHALRTYEQNESQDEDVLMSDSLKVVDSCEAMFGHLIKTPASMDA